MSRTVVLSVDVDEDAALPGVVEVLGRHLAGLALDGIEARLYVWEPDAEEDPS